MDVEDLFRKLRPIVGKRIDALRMEYFADRSARHEIEEILHLLAIQHLNFSGTGSNPLLPPPPPDKSAGSSELGTVLYADREVGKFGLRESEWIQHVSIFGRTGSGKTNVGFLIFQQLLNQQKPVWVFDWKRNYRDIAQELDVPILTVGRDVAPFGFNPIRPPPGTEPATWLKKLVEILSHAYGFRQASSYVLEKALFALHARKDAPTFSELQEELRSLKGQGREGQWIQSAKRVVGTLCFGPISRVLNSSEIDVAQLLTRSVVFELDALTDADKTFLIESLLLWIHQYRMQQPMREQFKHATLIEEAHHILLARAQARENVMDVVLREIRELGEAVILIDQHPSLISRPSLGNTYCTIAMNLKHGSDVSVLASAMQLDDSCREWLGRLDVGTAIVRLQGRWQLPFLVRFPKVEIDKGRVSDELISRNLGSSRSGVNIPPVRELSQTVPPLPRSDEETEGKRQHREYDERCLSLLADVAGEPGCGVAQRYKRLGLSSSAGDAVKNELARKGWVREVRVRLRGRNITALPITGAGLTALRKTSWDGEYATPDDHAGPAHEFWKAWLFSELRKSGIQVAAEKLWQSGHRVDLLAVVQGRQVAIEIETGKSNVKANLDAALREGLNQCSVVLVGNVAADKRVAPEGLRVLWVPVQMISSAADVIGIGTRKDCLQA